MRTALLPTPGDPDMLAYWLRNFATWRDQVDNLVVLVNGAKPDDVPGLRAMVLDAGGLFIDTPRRIGHDGALDALLLNAHWADHVVLCEDDAYVRHPEAVGAAFAKIEAGTVDIVGSPRHEDYASSPLQVWPRELTQDHEEVRRGLWPAFLFARRSDLLDTDRIYGDRRWNLGSTIRGLDMTVTPELCAFVGVAPDYIHLDTLFGTTFQLRAKRPVIELVHHVRLFDAAAVEQWIAEDPPWFHVTGLSTLDQIRLPLDQLPDLDEHGGLWTRRVAWWLRTFRDTKRLDDIWDFAERTGMRGADLDAWHVRFDAWERVAVPA